MIEKWNGTGTVHVVLLLTDLSIAFEFWPNPFLVAKLHAYGLDKTSSEYLKDYLSHRNILNGVPQGSIMDTLFFNVILCDLLLFIPNIGLLSYMKNVRELS